MARLGQVKHLFLRSSLTLASPLTPQWTGDCASAMTTRYDDNKLEGLLDAFGDSFSLEDIASAYCQAGKNADLAAELLYKSEAEGSSSSSSFASCGSSSETKSVDSFDPSYVMVRSKSSPVNGSMKKTKQIWLPSKPMKVESPPLPISSTLANKKEESGKMEMEDFLLDLLGAGFKLERHQIRTVLGHCGYDIKKSMQELLNISTENSARSCSSARKPSRDSVYTQRRCSGPSRSSRDEEVAVNNNDTELSDAFRSKIDREMEVLAALFTPAEITSELSRRNGTVNSLASSNAFDLAEGSSDELKTDSTGSQKDDDVDADLVADDFEVLRKAVKDYLVTKKEYYRAAVEAHAKGDHARAAKLIEQGEFFHQKARQADEESVQKIFKIRPNAMKPDDTLILDLHDYGPKEAIRLLKCHLSVLSAYRYCTLIISKNDNDATKGSRKRKIMKLLGEQSIQWTQGSEAGTILISPNKIEPDTL